MFGPNASLDLVGSFHVSTADYLRMGENEKFFVNPLENEVLSVAAPTAFGFLQTSELSGFISIEGKGEITEQEWNENNPTGLHVKEGNTISIIGGDIEIKNGTHFNTGEDGEAAKLKAGKFPGSPISKQKEAERRVKEMAWRDGKKQFKSNREWEVNQ